MYTSSPVHHPLAMQNRAGTTCPRNVIANEKTRIEQPGLRCVPDEIGVVASPSIKRAPLAHIRSLPFIDDLFGARVRSPPSASHPLSGVLVHARRGAAEYAQKLGCIRCGNGDDVVLVVALNISRVRNRVGRARVRDVKNWSVSSLACEDGWTGRCGELEIEG
jgi:hypothetical protein